MYKDKTVGVLGAGLEGVSSAAFLKSQGARVTLLDQKEQDNFEQEILEKIQSIEVEKVFGKEALDDVANFEVLVRTPGIRPDIPQIQAAVEKGAILTSNTKIFFDLSPARIIGVTGTKGKGTTATLINKILQTAGLKSYLGGNIGTPALDLLPSLVPTDFVVLELSSFQLFDLNKSPFVAVVLMITVEHLDWHKDSEEYRRAKFNIVRFQNTSGATVANIDYTVSKEFLNQTQGKKIEVSTKQEFISGVYVSNGAFYRRVGAGVERVIDINEVGLIGAHNLENIAAAIGAASALGIEAKFINSAVRNFKGLEHRLEFVREVGGVKYYNDSFSTTPETAIAAIKSFSQPQILILGGSDKGSDYTELGKTIVNSPHIKAVILVGLMGPRIKEAIDMAGVFRGKFLEGAKNMNEILGQVKSIVGSGDIVVLSPACASFDMFRNYKNRGEEFKRLVNSL